VVIPTSRACGYDDNWGILCKYQYRGETSPTLWVIDRGATSTTLLLRDPSTVGALYLNSSPWELRQGGRVGLVFLISDAPFQVGSHPLVQATLLRPITSLLAKLGDNICNLLICQYVMESNDSSLHHVSNEVILILYVLGLVMKYRTLY